MEKYKAAATPWHKLVETAAESKRMFYVPQRCHEINVFGDGSLNPEKGMLGC